MGDGSNLLVIIALLPFIGALVPGWMIRAGRNACATFTAVPTVLALVMLGILAPDVMRGEVIQARFEWLPQLGLSASFFLDGLGLLFAGMILGVGLLIILYARFYLSGDDPMGQFYTYLLLFQGAMLGIVLSDNILLLLVFWELTSLSSFLLIGYWKHLPEGRQGARMALAVTGGGGLALIAGLVLLAPAPDFTVELMEPELTDAQRADLDQKGYFEEFSEYSPDDPNIFTKAFFDDGRKNRVLTEPLDTYCPVHILQGMADPDVPYAHAQKLMEFLGKDDATLTLVKDGDHRLSRPQDLDLLARTVAAMAERVRKDG